MKHPGQIVLFRFPSTSLAEGKTRPALLLAKVPNDFDDWLLCMISSQLHQALSGLDEIVSEADTDFLLSGLKTTSLIRVTRLAVVSGDVLLGSTGQVDPTRLRRIKNALGTLDRGSVAVFCGCSPRPICGTTPDRTMTIPRPSKCARRD